MTTLNETETIKVLIAQLKGLRDESEMILLNQTSAEIGRYVSYKMLAITYNDLAESASKLLNVQSLFYRFNIEQIPGMNDTTWGFQKSVVEQVLLNSKLLLAALEESGNFADDEFDNLSDFLQSRLRSAIFTKPDREVEIQNAIEILLTGKGLSKGLDYDRESGKIEFSGKEYIPDFVISKMGLCIEVKLLREGRKSSIIEEISADITAYKKKYQRVLFVVYDLGVIQNVTEFKRDIEAADGVKVIVVKH